MYSTFSFVFVESRFVGHVSSSVASFLDACCCFDAFRSLTDMSIVLPTTIRSRGFNVKTTTTRGGKKHHISAKLHLHLQQQHENFVAPRRSQLFVTHTSYTWHKACVSACPNSHSMTFRCAVMVPVPPPFEFVTCHIDYCRHFAFFFLLYFLVTRFNGITKTRHSRDV